MESLSPTGMGLKEFKASKQATAELASQALHEMDAPSHGTAVRSVVAKYAEAGIEAERSKKKRLLYIGEGNGKNALAVSDWQAIA